MKTNQRARARALVALVLVAAGGSAAPLMAAVAPPVVPAPARPAARRRSVHATSIPAPLDPASSCRKFPAGKRIVRLNLKPDTELADLVAWISSITCKQFILSGSLNSSGKKVTIYAPEPITPEEAYRLFLDALDSVGLTVQRSGKFLQILETAKAKSGPIPFYGWDGRLWSAEPNVPK